MPRRFFKRYMPDQAKLKGHKHLSWLGEHLHNPNLWHLSRRSAARAFLVGIFCAFLPIPGQMMVAAVLAIWIGANLAVSVGLVWLTNPLTMPPLFFLTYKLGAWILGTEPTQMTWDLVSIQAQLSHIWWPLLLGSVVAGIVVSAISYLVINRLWIWQVQTARKRKLLKRLRNK